MADKAHGVIDERLSEMERHLTEIYTEAQRGIEQKAAKYFAQFAAADKEMRADMENGLISANQYEDWRKAKMMYGKKFSQMKEDIAAQLLNVNRTAIAYVNGELPEVYTLGYNALEEAVDGVGGYSFSLVDADTIKNLATSDASLLPFKDIDPAKDIPWNTKKINSQVLQGILQGESIPDIAARMQNVADMNRTAAIRTARTAVTGAENRGRLDSYARAEKDGIVLKKEWIATNDARTRHWHAELDGQTRDQDKPFENEFGDIMFPGDPTADGANVYNCRCSMAAVVLGFGNKKIENGLTNPENGDIITTDGFTPAQTKEDAIEYTSQYVQEKIGKYYGNIDFGSMDVSVINEVNRALHDVFAAYDLPKLRNIQIMNMREKKWRESTAEAAYNWLSQELYINGKYYKNAKTIAQHSKEYNDMFVSIFPKLQQAIDALDGKNDAISIKKRTLWSATLKSGRTNVNTVDAYGTIIHEMGHALDAEVFKLHLRQSTFDVKASMQKYGSQISGYAVENTMEYVAESFAAYWKGETDILDPDLLEIFRRYRK